AACRRLICHNVTCRNVTSAGAALALGEPATRLRRRGHDGSRMRNAEARNLREEHLRRLYPRHREWPIAEERPASGDLGEQGGAIFEACAIDHPEKRRRRGL